MTLLRKGSRCRNAAHVFGAASSSTRARNVYGPAVIRNISLTCAPSPSLSHPLRFSNYLIRRERQSIRRSRQAGPSISQFASSLLGLVTFPTLYRHPRHAFLLRPHSPRGRRGLP